MKGVTFENYEKLILEYDKKFSANDYNGYPIEGQPSYGYLKGNIPVMVSAPHSVKQVRNGVEKGWDGYVRSLK